jgi:hypothetical protein
MAENERSLTPRINVSVCLFCNLLSLEINVSTIEVFSIDPSNGLAINLDMV